MLKPAVGRRASSETPIEPEPPSDRVHDHEPTERAPLTLLTLPPELLVSILSLLPLRTLLTFSLCSRASHTLSKSSLHTLSLGIYPCPLNALIREPLQNSHNDAFDSDHRARLFIPGGERMEPRLLDLFHDRLLCSVLERYSESLRALELSVWRIPLPVASAIANLKGLRVFVLRREELRWGRRRRKYNKLHAPEEVWGSTGFYRILEARWTRLRVVRLEGLGVKEEEMVCFLQRNGGLREFWVEECEELGEGLLRYMAMEWGEREQLKCLGFEDCAVLGVEAVEFLGRMSGLEKLHVSRLSESAHELITEKNAELWKIPEFVARQEEESVDGLQTGAIEIDPEFT